MGTYFSGLTGEQERHVHGSSAYIINCRRGGPEEHINMGVWNFSGQNQYSVYYRLEDLAGDGC